jgi:hypothetical protein
MSKQTLEFILSMMMILNKEEVNGKTSHRTKTQLKQVLGVGNCL